MGILYIVASPIGNLKDITLRAIEVLQNAQIIACEDTRHTGTLLKQFQISNNKFQINTNTHTPNLLSYYEQNEMQRIPEIIALLKNDNNVALVSDAGTPTISDPGFKLVRECIKEGIRVESIPGPNAAVSALVSSGLPTDKFFFVGYLPHKPGHRKDAIKNIAAVLGIIKTTIIIYEAPHKIMKTLSDVLEVLGDIEIVLCRELTKMHEEIRREKISQSLAHFEKVVPKGEFVILFNNVILANAGIQTLDSRSGRE